MPQHARNREISNEPEHSSRGDKLLRVAAIGLGSFALAVGGFAYNTYEGLRHAEYNFNIPNMSTGGTDATTEEPSSPQHLQIPFTGAHVEGITQLP